MFPLCVVHMRCAKLFIISSFIFKSKLRCSVDNDCVALVNGVMSVRPLPSNHIFVARLNPMTVFVGVVFAANYGFVLIDCSPLSDP